MTVLGSEVFLLSDNKEDLFSINLPPHLLDQRLNLHLKKEGMVLLFASVLFQLLTMRKILAQVYIARALAVKDSTL